MSPTLASPHLQVAPLWDLSTQGLTTSSKPGGQEAS